MIKVRRCGNFKFRFNTSGLSQVLTFAVNVSLPRKVRDGLYWRVLIVFLGLGFELEHR